jgi:arginine/ornithine N-succinyltransferase beta subunit
VRRSQQLPVEIDAQHAGGTLHLIANTKLGDFRCAITELASYAGSVTLPPAVATALDLKAGDTARVSAL